MANTARVTKVFLEYGNGSTLVELDPRVVELIVIGGARFGKVVPFTPATERNPKLGKLVEAGGTGVLSVTHPNTDSSLTTSAEGEAAWWLSGTGWIHPEEDGPLA